MSLKDKSLKGIIWTFSESVGIKLVSVLTFFILAKLLGATAFGIVAIVNAIIHIGNIFVEQGLIAALVQRETVKEEHFNSAFWSNVILGLIVYFCIYIGAPYIAELYSQLELTKLLRVAGLIFVIAPSSLVHEARLTRNFDFRKIALSRIIGMLCGSTMGLSMAFLDFGVWSLIAQHICFMSISTILLWFFNRWIPGFEFSRTAFKEIFSFSYKMFLNGITLKLNRNSTELLIGYFLGPTSAGIYVFAYKIFQSTIEIVNMSINKVMLPLFSAVQKDITKVRDFYYRAIQNAYYFLIPLLLVIIFLAPSGIHLFFDKEWTDSIIILQLISIGGTIYMIFYYSNSIFVGLGKPELCLKFNAINGVLNIVLVSITAKMSLFWVAVSQIAIPILLLPVFYYLLNRLIGLSLLKLIQSTLKPLMVGGIIYFSLFLVDALDFRSNIFELVILGVVATLSFILAAFIVKAEWLPIALKKFEKS